MLLPMIGMGLQFLGGMGKAGSVEDASTFQAYSQRIRAKQALQAAAIAESDAKTQQMMMEYNVGAQNAYARMLLGAGEVNIANIKQQVASSIKQLKEQELTAMSGQVASAAGRGVSVSSMSSLDNLSNVQKKAEEHISDINYQGDISISKSMMETSSNYVHAKQTSMQEQIQGLQNITRLKTEAMGQRASSQVLMETARYTQREGDKQAKMMRISSFGSLLGNAGGEFINKFA